MNIELLQKAYSEQKLILFIGAGISKSLGVPDWDGLIAHIAEELDYDPAVFERYGTSWALAEYYRIRKGRIGPLRSWMDREWHNIEPDKLINSRIHELIATGKFDLIYTTNYDRWIENASKLYDVPFSKIARASDIPKIDKHTRQIVKFHGDFDDDSSIVLDETSYFERLDFETPLDIKLRADVLGRSVLFIGYSLSDINIRYLFYRLNKMNKNSGDKSIFPRSFVFSGRPNPIQEAVLDQWNISMIHPTGDDINKGLIDLLEQLCGI